MTTPRRLIVTGATGKQGGALIKALLSTPSQPFEIYAVTRNISSRGALALAAKPNVHVVQGDFNDAPAILSQVSQPWGLFSVTMPMNAKKEELQGKAMTAAAIASGVKHLVFTSVDRGIDAENNPTPVPHFASKYAIEKDIEAKAKSGDFTYTILRPVAFFENLVPGFLGKGFSSMWKLNGNDHKLQMVSTSDIGTVAAQAFLSCESEEYRNKGIPLAGDDITPAEAGRVFKEVTGEDMPETYSILGRTLKWLLHEQLGIMFNWFKSHGYKNDVDALRRRYPFLKDFRTWLEEESAWKKN